jgi:secreted trypsin-like serine protease
VLLAVVAAMLMLAGTPAGAITDGRLDGDDHPYVGLMVADDADGNPLWRCSGALISPTVYVTAGHCVEAPAAGATIWFETDVESQLVELGYPFGGPTSVDGTVHVFPDYDPSAFFLQDLGVVVLDEPVHVSRYASLPDVGLVDTFRKGRKGDNLTAVGYGLQKIVSNPVKGPIFLEGARIRYQADLMIVNTKGVAGIGNIEGTHSMVLSGDAKHGGTCFGDSGGPILSGDTIVAVVSFGLNRNCAGIGGVYRIDFEDNLVWIRSFL